MSDYNWTEKFQQCWEMAVESYRAGNRQPDTYPSLPEIGCSAQELYDFAEDWVTGQEPDFATALLVTAARRDYFLVVQNGRPSGRVVAVEDFPAKDAELAGFAWLPRILLKARCKLRGEMPDALMYCCGGDRAFLKKVNIHPADFLRVVWAAREDDRTIIEYVNQCACRSV